MIYFHGTPGSKLDVGFGEDIASALGVRVISFDRPGYGRSEPGAYSLGSMAVDADVLADHLGLERFTTLGWSGGGPFTLAAAARLGERVSRDGAQWTDTLEEPLTEASWLRDTLLPNLLAQGPDGRAGTWSIGRPRVLALQRRLRELVAQAPDVTWTRRVEALSAAVNALRRALDYAGTQVDFGGTSTVAALQQSQYELDDAIRALQPLAQEDGEQVPPG